MPPLPNQERKCGKSLIVDVQISVVCDMPGCDKKLGAGHAERPVVLNDSVVTTCYTHLMKIKRKEKCDTPTACALLIEEIKKQTEEAGESSQVDAGKENLPPAKKMRKGG